ncbi:MAG TPA: ester cyclase [Allosphingosinicella sp.]|jgi:predicted ester cyclase
MIPLRCFALLLAACTAAPAAAQPRPENREIGRIVLEEVLGRGRIAQNEHLYARDFVAHGATRDATRAEDRAMTEGWRAAFPDMEIRVERIVAEGDFVAVHFTARGTNSGSGNGLSPTGVRVEAGGITIFRITDGRIREEWSYTNFNDAYARALAARP